MNIKLIVIAVAVMLPLPCKAESDDALLRVRALREARKMVRSSNQGEVTVLKNTNFSGIWGGRYLFSSRGSNCSTRLSSFDFRHLLTTHGSSGYLATNHDGDFTGRSRDKGRRWEFVKSVTINGRPGALAIVYQNLARNGNSAATGAALSISGGCLFAYGANAIRLAR